MQNRLKWAYKKAEEVNIHKRAHHKRVYDRKVKFARLEIGDLVLVQQKPFSRKHKFSDWWENGPYTIVGKQKGIPVYNVEPVIGTGKMKLQVLYRNMLFPLAFNTHWEETLAADISLPEEDNEDEYVSTEEDEIGYSWLVTRSKARKLQHVKPVSKANRLLAGHFEDEKLIHPETLASNQPLKSIDTEFVAICRKF